MESTTLLQLFLYANVFIIGALTTLGVQHAYAHFRPQKPKADKPRPVANRLPDDVREQLLQKSQTNFENVLSSSADELQRSLHETGEQLNKALNKLGTAMVGNELERYHADLEQIRERVQKNLSGAQTELEQHQADLKAKMSADVEAERARLMQQLADEQARLIKQIDTKLADAVASFLVETMQHNVDLGSQSAYLTAMLDEHKDELKREVQA